MRDRAVRVFACSTRFSPSVKQEPVSVKWPPAALSPVSARTWCAAGRAPPRKAGDPLVALERAWERYHGNVAAFVKAGVTDENRAAVLSTIKKHVQAIESLREKVA